MKQNLTTSTKFALWAFLASSGLQLNAQVYVNKEWETETAVLGSQHHKAATILDGNGNVLSVANKRDNGKSDIHTSKKNPHGNLEWQDLLTNLQNGSTTQNYGTDIKRDSQGNIYICGAYFNGVDYDMLVVKYNGAGAELWRRQYNGTGNSDDAPASMVLDNSGNIYVTGGSFGVNSQTDFLTLKINGSTGTIIWNARYDFNNKYDGATTVKLDSQGDVYVCGSSAQNDYDSDFTVIKYNPSNGNQIQVKRHATSQNGYDIPIGMEIDANDNLYVLGSANYGLNSDLKLVSYNSSLIVNWATYFDGSGLADEAGGIDLDNVGNLVITGSTKNNLNETKMLTAKYDHTNGNLIWKEEHGTTPELTASKGSKVKTNALGDIFILGEVTINGVSHVKVLSFDPTGKKRWERTNENPSLNPQQALDLIVDGDDIFLTGIKDVNSNPNLFTVKLQQKPVVGEFLYDQNGTPMYAKNHLIVRFQKNALNLTSIDNLDIQFSKPGYFLKPHAEQEFFDVLKPKTGTYDKDKVVFYRIYPYMKSTEDTAISHLGEEVQIPDLYGAFMVEFPEDFDMPEVSHQLGDIFPTVAYTDPILAKIPLTSDPDYTLQASLHPTVEYPDAGINLEEAWNYTTAKPFVRVGIFDSGVDAEHEDFGDGPTQSSIRRSYDFQANEDITANFNNDNLGHGTMCAGVIGAIRNNNKGIAGIAGGDGTFNNGASIYSLRILMLPYGSVMTDEFNAISEACQSGSGSPYRYGVHVQNHSWVYAEGFYNGVFDDDNLDLIRENIRLASRLQTTIVAGRGNNGVNTPNFPASSDEDWVLCVGGTGTDGHYWDAVNDNSVNGEGVEWYQHGDYGPDVDIAAPASSKLIYTTKHDSPTTYGAFDGTSAAAAHVTGVVALLMSYYNNSNPNVNDYNDLAPEDCEKILELSATDVNTAGYDEYTGYGRLNAGKALAQIDRDIFTLRHIKSNMYQTSEVITQLTPASSYDEVKLLESYENLDGIWFEPQNYLTKRFRISHEIEHDIDVDSFFRASWTRATSSNILDDINANNELKAHERVFVEEMTHDHAKLFGYAYAVYDMQNTFLGWWPSNITNLNVKMEYSVLLCDELTANVVKLADNNKMQVFPNPSNGNQKIILDLATQQDIKVSLTDLSGKELLKVYEGKADKGKLELKADLSNLSTGLYVYKISLGNNTKFVKTQKL
ncbi:MAG: S8 family serine peptidase [Bacteroidota bacterium]